MTRRVLIICYYFPPLGLAGVTRPLQLFKRLTSHGYECHVLTVKPVAYYAYEPELLNGLDESKIHRAGSRDPSRLLYLCGMRHLPGRSATSAGKFGSSVFPDSRRGWIEPAVRLGRKLIAKHKFDFILSTSPPISAHVVASRLAKQTGVKWVADFRDLWSTRAIEDTYSNSSLIQQAQQFLGEVGNGATAKTAVNRSIGDYIGTADIITNGFDPELARCWSNKPDTNKFVIGLLGTFNHQLPVEPLLKCLSELRVKNESDWNRVRVVQVGRVDRDWLLDQLNKYDMSDRCAMYGLQSRERTIELLNAASLFYLGIGDEKDDRITTARVYDLLASGRPIFAYTRPNSELAKLVNMVPDGLVFAEDSTGLAVERIRQLISKHAGGDTRFEPIPEHARPYSWDNVAAQFASLFIRLG